MSRPGVRGRGEFSQDTLTAELTTGQIVIMACVALGVACLMFALGVLVGRYDPTEPATQPTLAAPEPAPQEGGTGGAPALVVAAKPPETPEIVQADPPPPAPVVATPEPVTAPVEPATEPAPAAGTAATTPSTQTASLSESVRPRVTRVEPLPLSVGGTAATPSKEQMQPLPETKPATAPASNAPTITTTAPAKPAEPVTVSTMEDDGPALMEAMPTTSVKVAEVTPPASKPATAVPASIPKGPLPGKFVIQIASFTQTGGTQRAEEYAQRIRSSQGLDARVTPSKDGKSYSVVVVGYSEKGSADKACAEIKKLAGFKDAWVRPI